MSTDNSKAEEPIAHATVIQHGDRAESFLPPPSKPSRVDPEIYDAWRKHIVGGFHQNNEMFRKLLDGFMRPYWLTVWMYRLLFVVGLLAFGVAIILGVWLGIGFATLFGGLSAVMLLSFFIGQPLRALEQNLEFITWLGISYNTYWTRLMYANDERTIQKDLETINKTAVEDITALIDKHAELAGKRPSFGK
ncbi:MAG: hypothetical protein ABI874_03010 [Chloroflexota bacterium]